MLRFSNNNKLESDNGGHIILINQVDVISKLIAPTIEVTTLDVGDLTLTGELDVDNLNFSGNTIISSDTNGDINITPDGSGTVNVSDLTATTANITTLETDTITINGGNIIAMTALACDSATVGNLVTTGHVTVGLETAGTLTLTENSATSDIANTGVTASSIIVLTPTSVNASANFGDGGLYISSLNAGVGFTITHANDANVDKTFNYMIMN